MMISQTGEGKPSRRGASTSRRADKNAHGQTGAVNLPRRELVQTIGEGEGQLQPILKSGLRWAFRIMDCRDTRGYDVTLTDNQKRAMIKRVADALEKLGVAGLAVGIFQGNVVGAVCGIAFIGVSLALTYYLER